MIEVNCPNKIFLGLDKEYNLIYQSAPIPPSWVFMQICEQNIDRLTNLKQIKMELVYKRMILDKLDQLKVSNKGAMEGGQIYFSDKCVDIFIFSSRDQQDQIKNFYLAFDQPKKKYDDQMLQSQTLMRGSQQFTLKAQDLTKQALSLLRDEKMEKACGVIKDYLKISFGSDQILEILREKELENELTQEDNITEDIRGSYVIEYYRTDTARDIQKQENQQSLDFYDSQQIIQQQQLTNIKKLDALYLDIDDINNVSKWSFNICDKSNINQIRYSWGLFYLCNYIDHYQIKHDIFYQFLIVIQEKYTARQNPFHNFQHGFSVAHACFYMIKNKLLNPYLEQLEQFSALLASLCHDIDHPGRTNAFEMAKSTKLALKYNDDSVLENHHAAQTFKILSKDQYNILQSFSQEQLKIIRKCVIMNILSTDMKKHFDFLKIFEMKLAKLQESGEPIIQKDEDRKLFSGMIVHTCDFAHKTKPFSQDKEWSMRICKEFNSQVEEEQQLSLPITPYLQNLTNMNNIAKNEINFIKVCSLLQQFLFSKQIIVRPIFELTNLILDRKLVHCLENIENNQEQWNLILNDFK